MLCLWLIHAVTSPIAAMQGLARAIRLSLARNEEVQWNRFYH